MNFRRGILLFSLLIVSLGVTVFYLSLTTDDLTSEDRVLEIEAASGQFDSTEMTAVFNNQPVVSPRKELALKPQEKVLAAVSPEEKWIEIDLTKQRLKAHEGGWVVYDFPVSTGKFGRTPTGDFRIWIKIRYTKMSGGSRALGTYYYLPNVPYTMYFYKGFGVHGTYWHNNFGHPMSHGCVNMRTPDAEKLFYWADPQISPEQHTIKPTKNNPGTRVIVHGVAPRE